jgi:O-antigen/teichoic acid export membrane protein
VKPLLLIGLIAVFRGWSSFDGEELVLLSSMVLAVCCLILFYLVGRKVKQYALPRGDVQPDRSLAGKTFYFFLVSLLYLLSTKITMLILPYFTQQQKDIGIFNIGYRFADLLIFPFFLMHTVLPQLFARHSVTERAYTQSLFNESNKLMTLLCIPLLLLNLLGGRWLLHWFGSDFTVGYAAMIYISLAQFLFSFFGPANTILLMQDREKYSAGCLLFYVVVLLVTSWWLIPVAGITGGAMAILISSLLYNILLAVVTYRLTGICSPFFSFLVRAH